MSELLARSLVRREVIVPNWIIPAFFGALVLIGLFRGLASDPKATVKELGDMALGLAMTVLVVGTILGCAIILAMLGGNLK